MEILSSHKKGCSRQRKILLLAMVAVLGASFLVPSFVFTSPAYAATMCSYAGPDTSEDNLQLTDFLVTGNKPAKVGDFVRVSFSIRNVEQKMPIKLADYGILVRAKSPSGDVRIFGYNYKDYELKPGEKISLTSGGGYLNEEGTWVIWPSYQIRLPNGGTKYGPDEWHTCVVEVEPAAPSPLPDLTITEINCDRQNNRIGYVIRNIGEGVAPGGHHTALYVDGKVVAEDTVGVDLKSGESRGSWFKDYHWLECHTIEVRVCADRYNKVEESSEQNNCLGKTCICEKKLPDLTITEINCDQENGRIGYVIKNIGDELAKAGYATTLYVDGKEVTHDSDGINLTPGATHESWFKEYEWPECRTIKARVCADNYNQVEESNEQNNCLEKVCECLIDIIPPQIIYGPSVSQVTQTSVVICWGTDEASDSLVRYDSHAEKYSVVTEAPNLVKEHCLTLTKLEPATTCHFVVESKDSSGNGVRSRDFSFQTLSTLDKEKPRVSLRLPKKLSGAVSISADADDNIGVERVVFLLDGKAMHTDYAFPFEWLFDTAGFGDGSHSFGVQAFDLFGNMVEVARDATVQNHFQPELSPVHVQIINLEGNDAVYGSVPVTAEIRHDFNWRIRHVEFRLDDRIVWQTDYEEGGPRRIILGGSLTREFETAYCDFGAFELDSTHIIEVGVEDECDNWGWAGIRVRVVRPEVSLLVNTSRESNYFVVTVYIRNEGEVDVQNLTIEQGALGFQYLETAYMETKPRGGDWSGERMTAICHVLSDLARATELSRDTSSISAELGTLQSGYTYKLEYYAVPILFPTNDDVDYYFGDFNAHYEAGGIEGTAWYPEVHMRTLAINGAFRDADYLIVTNPRVLYDWYHSHELPLVLAELAKERNGVLGYLPDTGGAALTPDTVKGLISPGGTWYEKLNSFGYLLIVGQTDVVPSFDVGGLHQVAAEAVVHDTDYPYADIYGNDHVAELTVGRIIGESAQELTEPMRASLDVSSGRRSFDRSTALLVSGWEGLCENFIVVTNEVADILSEQGVRVEIAHTEYTITNEVELLREALVIRGDYDGLDDTPTDLATLQSLITVEEAEELERQRRGWPEFPTYGQYSNFPADMCEAGDFTGRWIKEKAVNKDILFWYGHGGPGGWAWVVNDFESYPPDCAPNLWCDLPENPLSFGSKAPVVFAASCETGNYEREEGRSGARAFLRHGAAVYIGNTEVQGLGACTEVSMLFFGDYWNRPYISVGDALMELKNHWVRTAYSTRSWDIHEMNIYGDPKFGGE